MSLFDRLYNWRLSQQHKHEQGDTHAEEEINDLANFDFLRELSDAADAEFGLQTQQRTALRDQFAAAALPAIVTTTEERNAPWPTVAAEAYELADAMLREREK